MTVREQAPHVGRLARRVDSDEQMHAAIKAGIADGLREVMADDVAMAAFWKRGYKELTTHGSTAASQWIGKRILTALVAALFVICLTWLVKTGGLR